jgi:Mrp family chromosome partitioning ATPase
VLPKYKLGGGQELEVFGLPNSAGKSVLLSGNAVVGEFQEAVNLHELLMDWGIIEQHQLQEPKPATPSQSFDFTQLGSRLDDSDLDRAVKALHHISPDCDYDQWIELGQALHTEFGEAGLGPWMTWSMAGNKFAGTKDIEVHWKSFHQGKGVGIGTLFKHAKDNGWEPPTKQAERKSAVEDFAAVINAPVATDAPQGWPERTLSIGQIRPIRYMVKGFWAHSFMVLAGQPGIGKTTAVISLCMVMAGLQAKDCELTATKKRKTIIVTEDSDQVERTLTGYSRHYGISASDLSQWFVIIDAKRSNVKDLLMLAHNVIHHTIDNVRPLLVLDTANATMDIDNENDNSEVGAYIAALKQTIYIQLDTPVCIITHTNKTISKSDSDATARGASAFTGDATLTGILFEDETKTRYMRLVKTRYQPNFREIKFQSDVFADTVLDEDGDIQEQMVLLVVPQVSSEEDRRQAANDRQNDKRQQQVQDAADAACNFVQSIINAKGAVIMRRGSGRPSVPKELTTMHQLEWADIYQAVPVADQSYARKAVSAAIFQRFAMDQASSGWVQIK